MLLALLLSVCLSVSAQNDPLAHPMQIHSGPGVTPDIMNIGWTSVYDPASQAGVVNFGRSPLALSFSANGTASTFLDGAGFRNITMNLAVLTGLLVDTRYYYQVVQGSAVSPVYSFLTLPTVGTQPSAGPLSLILFGDMGSTNAESLPAITRDVQSGKWNLGIGIGDYAYDMYENNGTRGDTYFSNLEPVYAQLPFITTPGNHEEKYNFSHYTNRWNTNPTSGKLPFGTGSNVRGRPNNWFFSVDVGLVHFVTIDSEAWFQAKGVLLEQLEWLKQDLRKANENRANVPWLVVWAHRSLYCSCDADCDTDSIAVRNDTEPLFHKFGVDLFINAHEHNYERLYAIYEDQYVGGNGSLVEDPPATVYVISGDAGNREGHEPFRRPQPNWSAVRSNTYGYARMYVHNATHLQWEQVMTDSGERPEDYGKVIDTMWLVHHNHGSFESKPKPVFDDDMVPTVQRQIMSRMTGLDGPSFKTLKSQV